MDRRRRAIPNADLARSATGMEGNSALANRRGGAALSRIDQNASRHGRHARNTLEAVNEVHRGGPLIRLCPGSLPWTGEPEWLCLRNRKRRSGLVTDGSDGAQLLGDLTAGRLPELAGLVAMDLSELPGRLSMTS